MHNIVRKALEIYLREKRLPTQADISAEHLKYLNEKSAIFVTLYLNGRVIASRWRIQPQKENSLYECIDLSLSCLKDQRFAENIHDPSEVENLQIRVDVISATSRRLLKNIDELSVRDEGIIFLSQELGKMSVILPNMIKDAPTPAKYLDLAKQKAGVPTSIIPDKYVIYALKTQIFSDI